MAGNVTKKIKWGTILDAISKETGIPKKVIEDVHNGGEKVLTEMVKTERPANIGEITQLNTPYCAIRVLYSQARTYQNPKTGEKFERAPCYGISLNVPKAFVDSANTGIKLEKAAPPATEGKKKTA